MPRSELLTKYQLSLLAIDSVLKFGYTENTMSQLILIEEAIQDNPYQLTLDDWQRISELFPQTAEEYNNLPAEYRFCLERLIECIEKNYPQILVDGINFE